MFSKHWDVDQNPPGVATASLVLIASVSTIVGAIAGGALARFMPPVMVAIATGLLGTAIAGLVRNTLLVQFWGRAGVADVGTPAPIVMAAIVASLAGSLAADRLSIMAGALPAVVLGGLAGLLSALLFALLIISYRFTPEAAEPEAQPQNLQGSLNAGS